MKTRLLNHRIFSVLFSTLTSRKKEMFKQTKLVSAVLAMAVILLSVGNAIAFAVFTSGGVKMICRTCSCAELSDAGVPLGNCVDALRTGPKVYDKIIRYSANDVKLHSPDGRQFPLSSDAAQATFDEISTKPNFKQLVNRLKPAAGAISKERVERLAKELGVEVVGGEDMDGTVAGGQGGEATVLATIRDGRLLSLRSVKASDKSRVANDVYRAQARSLGGKLVLNFDRPLSSEPKMELKIDAPLNLDRATGTALDTCGCLKGTFLVANANATNPVVTLDAPSLRPKHRWGTKYRVNDCPKW